MNYQRLEAIDIMNEWGAAGIPFLFVIDFEMKAIKLYRTNMALPNDVAFNFSSKTILPAINNLHNNITLSKFPVSKSEYEIAFTEVQRQIFAGNSFLVNLTFASRIEINLTLREIYQKCNAKYKLLIDNEFVVFSPETFVTITNGVIASYPMKGTISADITDAASKILASAKETAEHNTIVDLIRNDLSIIASNVKVNRFRYIDRISTNYGDLLQVSSEITGILPHNYNASIGTLLFSLLPAGSVTGAPKQRTIEIVRNVEGQERGYYTGVCGYFDGKNLDSAVMIRFIENRNNHLWFRSGGGITCNSVCNDEYNELIQKVYVPIV